MWVGYSEELGLSFGAEVAEAPGSLKMEGWTWALDNWTQDSDITLEVSGGSPEEFMFNLSEEVDLTKVGKLVEESKQRLKDEKGIKGVLELVSINAPDDADKSKMEYRILVQPEHGGTTFTFTYTLEGQFVEMSY